MNTDKRVLRIAALVAAWPLFGWGPHPQIVDAALAVLPAQDHIGERLGADTGRLRLLVWMGDLQNSFVPIHETFGIDSRYGMAAAQFYANDYLIFPLAPRFYQHEVPDVTNTYRPFFLRSLQALRTETPSNAARWIGSLLHYVTDTGAPPHAAAIRGETHSKMENWVNGSRIDISGYAPKPLGKTDEEAVQGLLRRMTGLIEFSRQRAERLRPLVAANDRAACEPIALESANECARVAADVIHTLLARTAGPESGARLEARIAAPSVAGMEIAAGKLILLDTSYSTLSEPLAARAGSYQGTFELRNLPAGRYRPVVYRVGCATLFAAPILLNPGASVALEWKLEPDSIPGNLVRNPDFRIRWTSKDRPEHWQYNGARDVWGSDNIRIAAGGQYRVVARAKPAARPEVLLQWLRREWPQELGDAIEVRGEVSSMAPPDAAYARLMVRGRESPAVNLEKVALAEEHVR